MPNYACTVITPSGLQETREAAAPDGESLRAQLEEEGCLVRSLREKRSWRRGLEGRGVGDRELHQATQELVTLLRSGVTVPEALELAADRPNSPVLGPVLRKIREDVLSGAQLSEACAKYPGVFDGLYLSSLRTGERSGDLSQPLSRYLEYLERRIALGDKVSQAMVYPAFLMVVLIGVLAVLFAFVLPRFAALYSEFNAEMPLPTRILMTLVGRLPLTAAAAAGAGLAAWLGGRAWAATRGGRLWLDRAKLRLPVLREFTGPFLVSQLARTLSTLLAGGTTLAEALSVTGESLPNAAFASGFRRVTARVLEGGSFSGALEDERLLPRAAVKMIRVGESAGQLEAMLRAVAEASERTLERRIQGALTLVEPVFILAAGLLVGSVIVVMYLPILRLADVVR